MSNYRNIMYSKILINVILNYSIFEFLILRGAYSISIIYIRKNKANTMRGGGQGYNICEKY